MITITKLEQKTFEGKPSGFKVTLSDGATGNLQEKESDKGLREGDVVIVTLIPYTSKKGVTSNLLGLKRIVGTTTIPNAPQQSAPPQQAYGQLKPSTTTSADTLQIKANASIKAMEFVINCFIADKINWDKIQPYYKEILGYLNDGIDECSSAS